MLKVTQQEAESGLKLKSAQVLSFPSNRANIKCFSLSERRQRNEVSFQSDPFPFLTMV